jgi:murein DD-endopeptidase MepM/ murein hydrolase activator NlpD
MSSTEYRARHGSATERDRSVARRRLVCGATAALLGALAVLASGSGATATPAQAPAEAPAQQAPAPQGPAAAVAARPDFRLPFACGAKIELKTYRGHKPVDKKIDMYRVGMPRDSPILASAAGLVHEEFYPGGIEIDHGNGWFTVYLHMKSHVRPGTRVRRGQQIGVMGTVGTGAVHLHYEQLDNPGSHDADNQDIVNPVIQGEGPIVMHPDRPLLRTSTNCGGSPPSPAPAKYWVDTFANAPGRATPGGTRTGTLRKGRNYVYCKVRGPEVRVGSAWNRWWLKTDLDVGPANQWVSAYYLARWGNDEARDINGTVIRTC